jgi:hypothetical protein
LVHDRQAARDEGDDENADQHPGDRRAVQMLVPADRPLAGQVAARRRTVLGPPVRVRNHAVRVPGRAAFMHQFDAGHSAARQRAGSAALIFSA